MMQLIIIIDPITSNKRSSNIKKPKIYPYGTMWGLIGPNMTYKCLLGPYGAL